MRLAGMTLDPVLVPRFLKQLGRGGQFVGHRFDTFELAAGEGGALHFTITGPRRRSQVKEMLTVARTRFRRAQLRERALIAASLIGAGLAGVGLDDRIRAIDRRMATVQSDVASLRERIVSEVAVADAAAKGASRTIRTASSPTKSSADARSQIAGLDAQLESLVGGFVAPSMMPVLLEDVVRITTA